MPRPRPQDDSSLTRSNQYMLELFERSNLQLLYNVKQRNFPKVRPGNELGAGARASWFRACSFKERPELGAGPRASNLQSVHSH